MKITIYELLGLVKDGKAPNHIRYKNEDWYWGYDTYIPEKFLKDTPDVQTYTSLFSRYRLDYCLNKEVDIIEGIEKISLPSFEDFESMSVEKRYEIIAKEYYLLDVLIDEINKLKEQLNPNYRIIKGDNKRNNNGG